MNKSLQIYYLLSILLIEIAAPKPIDYVGIESTSELPSTIERSDDLIDDPVDVSGGGSKVVTTTEVVPSTQKSTFIQPLENERKVSDPIAFRSNIDPSTVEKPPPHQQQSNGITRSDFVIFYFSLMFIIFLLVLMIKRPAIITQATQANN